MSLETQDIVIIVAAVVGALLLILCLINMCYFLWLRNDKRFSDFRNDGKDGGHHHYEHRSGAYQYNMTPDNQFESSMEITSDGPNGQTRYHRVQTS